MWNTTEPSDNKTMKPWRFGNTFSVDIHYCKHILLIKTVTVVLYVTSFVWNTALLISLLIPCYFCISVWIKQDVCQWVHQNKPALCAAVQQVWCIYKQPPGRVPVTVRREHPAEGAGLLKTGGLPSEHPFCGPPGVLHGWGKGCNVFFKLSQIWSHFLTVYEKLPSVLNLKTEKSL